MKLYTEENVLQMLRSFHNLEINVQLCMLKLTPIELPSDEEIENYVQDSFTNCVDVQKYTEKVQLLMKAMCRAGMKGMRNKIQGGNK